MIDFSTTLVVAAVPGEPTPRGGVGWGGGSLRCANCGRELPKLPLRVDLGGTPAEGELIAHGGAEATKAEQVWLASVEWRPAGVFGRRTVFGRDRPEAEAGWLEAVWLPAEDVPPRRGRSRPWFASLVLARGWASAPGTAWGTSADPPATAGATADGVRFARLFCVWARALDDRRLSANEPAAQELLAAAAALGKAAGPRIVLASAEVTGCAAGRRLQVTLRRNLPDAWRLAHGPDIPAASFDLIVSSNGGGGGGARVQRRAVTLTSFPDCVEEDFDLMSSASDELPVDVHVLQGDTLNRHINVQLATG